MNAFASPSRLAPQLSAIRAQFPILAQTVHGKPLVYLDNAATAQNLQIVSTGGLAVRSTSTHTTRGPIWSGCV